MAEPLAANTAEPLLDPVESELADQNAPLPFYDVFVFPADFSLAMFVDKCRRAEIRIPTFEGQRVWTPTQSGMLMDSFDRGLPVPPIYLYRSREDPQLLVVDGKQRLKTILSYFGASDERPSHDSRLSDFEPENAFEDSSYEDLDDRWSTVPSRIRHSVLRAYVVKQLDPADDATVFHLFERLHNNRTQHLPQEIRNCVHQGDFNNLLKELNTFPPWRSIIGIAPSDPRLRDVELILRFLALLEEGDTYRTPMKSFLSQFMASKRSLNDTQRWKYYRAFTRTAEVVLAKLGEKPFHIRSGLNIAAFDSVFVSIARNYDRLPADINERYSSLILRNDFIACTTNGTTDPDVVARRVSLATDAFGGSNIAQ